MKRARSRGLRVVASCLSLVTATAATGLDATLALADGVDKTDKADKDRAIATDLFDRGVKLMADGKCLDGPVDAPKCIEALDAFRRAYQIYPAALGALRNAAYCEKGLGMVASASRDFREVARKAPLDPKPERQAWAEYARKEADELAPRIPRLEVRVPDAPAGTKVLLDGAPLAEAAWGTRLDVDPGDHSVHAEAPGRVTFEVRVAVAEKESKQVTVVLDVDATAAPPTVTRSGGSRTAPLVVSGIGLVGVGVGLGLGYASLKKRDDACGGTKLCDPQGLDDGKKLANVSTIVTGVGATVLVGGLVWLILAPKGAPAAETRGAQIVPFVSDRSAGLAAFGTF
jgi:hypothetical protein